MVEETPSLEHMLFEHMVVEGLLTLAELRIKRGVRIPSYMLKTITNFSEAYLCVIRENFPEEMAEHYSLIEKKLDSFLELYENKQKPLK
ncbi:MAG: hypothetical protein ABIA37_01040 [Candidatus Woesearchaeota archaeon]